MNHFERMFLDKYGEGARGVLPACHIKNSRKSPKQKDTNHEKRISRAKQKGVELLTGSSLQTSKRHKLAIV